MQFDQVKRRDFITLCERREWRRSAEAHIWSSVLPVFSQSAIGRLLGESIYYPQLPGLFLTVFR